MQEGCMLLCWLWTMDDGWPGHKILWACCEREVPVLTKCSQNFVSFTENCQRQLAKFSSKNPGLLGELIPFKGRKPGMENGHVRLLGGSNYWLIPTCFYSPKTRTDVVSLDHLRSPPTKSIRPRWIAVSKKQQWAPFRREWEQFRLVKVKKGIGIRKGILSEIQIWYMARKIKNEKKHASEGKT